MTYHSFTYRVYFDTDDLVKYFLLKKAEDALPTLADIRSIAQKLACQYATSQAYQQSLEDPVKLGERGVPFAVPPSAPLESLINEQERDKHRSEQTDPEAEPQTDSEAFKGDWALANSVLLMRDGLLFLEACSAVATGDIGRVWEVLKVSLFCLSLVSVTHSNDRYGS